MYREAYGWNCVWRKQDDQTEFPIYEHNIYTNNWPKTFTVIGWKVLKRFILHKKKVLRMPEFHYYQYSFTFDIKISNPNINHMQNRYVKKIANTVLFLSNIHCVSLIVTQIINQVTWLVGLLTSIGKIHSRGRIITTDFTRFEQVLSWCCWLLWRV